LVRETTPGPANYAGAHRSQHVDDLLADAANVGNPRVLTHPDAVINNPAQMLYEVTVNLRRDHSDRLVQDDVDAGI
jgi:hypothetical protein